MSLDRAYYLSKREFRFEDVGINQPQSVLLQRGNYLFECYGAKGGGSGGRGAYTSAIATIEKEIKIYIYLGGIGEDRNHLSQDSAGGYNGGGNGGAGCFNGTYNFSSGSGGGGATDIRLIDGEWNNSESLKSRIMVAGGGGGSGWHLSGGNGGKQVGLCAEQDDKLQIICGGNESTGNFGYGLNGANGAQCAGVGSEGKGGGGGGYYGGLASQVNGRYSNGGGGGGSSYISGDIGFEPHPDFLFRHALILDGSETNYNGQGLAIISKIYLLTNTRSFILHKYLFLFSISFS